MSDDTLPPLPKAGPVCFADAQSILTYKVPAVGRHFPGVLDVALWTSDQMRSYAAQAVAAERERCAHQVRHAARLHGLCCADCEALADVIERGA